MWRIFLSLCGAWNNYARLSFLTENFKLSRISHHFSQGFNVTHLSPCFPRLSKIEMGVWKVCGEKVSRAKQEFVHPPHFRNAAFFFYVSIMRNVFLLCDRHQRWERSSAKRAIKGGGLLWKAFSVRWKLGNREQPHFRTHVAVKYWPFAFIGNAKKIRAQISAKWEDVLTCTCSGKHLKLIKYTRSLKGQQCCQG